MAEHDEFVWRPRRPRRAIADVTPGAVSGEVGGDEGASSWPSGTGCIPISGMMGQHGNGSLGRVLGGHNGSGHLHCRWPAQQAGLVRDDGGEHVPHAASLPDMLMRGILSQPMHMIRLIEVIHLAGITKPRLTRVWRTTL